MPVAKAQRYTMAGKAGLGRGLDALIRETPVGVPKQAGSVLVPLGDIVPNPNQPRKAFNEKALDELAASISAQGLLQPILVRPVGESMPGKYEIVAGERRWRACGKAGLKEIPVVVKSMNAQETLLAALVENLQREDLNPIEEALGIHILKEEFALSQEDLAQKLGKSRSAIANCLRLLSLPEIIQEDLAMGRLSAGHARALLGITDVNVQLQLREAILANGHSVRETEGLAAQKKAEEATSAEQEGETKPAKVRGKRSQSEKIVQIQEELGAALNMPIKVTGSDQRGKVSISYSSYEELETLLQRLYPQA